MPTGVYLRKPRKPVSQHTKLRISLANRKSLEDLFRLKDQPLEMIKEGEDWKSFPCVVTGTGRMIRSLYTRLFGSISNNMCVCHFCDKPTCRQPKHWFIASQAENLMDMENKKRSNYQNQYTKKKRLTDGEI
jgi:hypothetical protein